MTYKEIERAVRNNNIVCWNNSCYIVEETEGTFYIKCLVNNHKMPLLYNGELEEDEKDFFISEVK